MDALSAQFDAFLTEAHRLKAAYATQINSRVDGVQSTINDGLFGWVNGTTTTLNDTVNAFYTDVQNVVNSVFNNTPLNEPLQEFLRCFLGSKVDAIETALTFLHDNLVIDIPRVNDSVVQQQVWVRVCDRE